MEMIKKIFSIARFEVKKHRTKDEKKVILILLLLALIVYSSISLFMELGVAGNEVFYKFNTEDGNITNILEATGKFQQSPEAEADVFIEAEKNNIFVFAESTDRGKAAISSLEAAVKSYNNQIYDSYDEIYAYPLRINVINIQRESGTLDSAIGMNLGLETENIPEENNREDEEDGSIDEPEEEKREEDSDDEDVEAEYSEESDEGITKQDESETMDADQDYTEYVSAQEMNPFSQFNVLIIVVILTLPLAMISLIYSNSIMAEKVNKRGIFMLMAPLNKFEIIAGKTAPYFMLCLSVFLPVIISNSTGLGSGLYATFIASGIILAYLSIAFTSAMLSRSHKELSFVGIFFISLYSCYLLIPAFMMNFSVISLASPLTIIAMIFNGEFVNIQLFIFSILPTMVSALLIFYLGSKLFNDTNMFSYEKMGEKIFSALYQIVKKKRFNIFYISFFSVPLIFLIQLMMIVVLLSIRNISALFLMMFFGALVEETFKNMAPYTLISKDKKISTKTLAYFAVLTGAGFFVAEKFLMFITIAPFIEAYSSLIMTGFIVPLLLHTIISFIFFIVAKKTKQNSFAIALLVSTIIHFGVNITLSMIAVRGSGS